MEYCYSKSRDDNTIVDQTSAVFRKFVFRGITQVAPPYVAEHWQRFPPRRARLPLCMFLRNHVRVAQIEEWPDVIVLEIAF